MKPGRGVEDKTISLSWIWILRSFVVILNLSRFTRFYPPLDLVNFYPFLPFPHFQTNFNPFSFTATNTHQEIQCLLHAGFFMSATSHRYQPKSSCSRVGWSEIEPIVWTPMRPSKTEPLCVSHSVDIFLNPMIWKVIGPIYGMLSKPRHTASWFSKTNEAFKANLYVKMI